jgi:DNA-binding XRE family transcriptional regulator
LKKIQRELVVTLTYLLRSGSNGAPSRAAASEDLAPLLQEAWQKAGKSQQQVADALGLKQPSLSKLEKQADADLNAAQDRCRTGG